MVVETNVTGCFLMARAAAAAMMRGGRGGAIVNIASIAGLVGTPADVLDAVGYSASKGAVISLTRDLAVKWARHGIRVNAIAPGFFETRMTTGVLERSRAAIERSTPMGRIGRPGELQGAALFLASPASAYVTATCSSWTAAPRHGRQGSRAIAVRLTADIVYDQAKSGTLPAHETCRAALDFRLQHSTTKTGQRRR